MGPINTFLDVCKESVRRVMRKVARGINKATGGKLTPDTVTIVGLLAHLPIAYFIADGQWYLAAVLLVIFGLFDTLDGDLARLQGVSSPSGMLLDSTTDRMKEIILYTGIGYYLVNHAAIDQDLGLIAVAVVAAVGGSMLTSYVNAWGEVVMAQAKLSKHAVNQAFRGGLMRFEVRMFLLVFALVTGWLLPVVMIIACLAWFTALDRLANIRRKLDVQD